MKDVDYFREACESIKLDDPAYSIWLYENGRELSSVGNWTNFDLDDKLIASAHKAAVDCIVRVRRYIQDSAVINFDLWFLILSDLSSAYSVIRYIKRSSEETEVVLGEDDIAEVASAISDRKDETFFRALDTLRRRNPNPLPPALFTA